MSEIYEGRLSVSCVDWNKIKAEYIAGGTSYRKLAEKYGVSFSTLRKVAAKEKWTELRDKAGAKTDTEIVNTVSGKNAKKAIKIDKVADKLLDKISTLIDTVHDTQGIKHISSALKDIKEIKGYKSALDLKEQEARIAKLQKEAEKVDDSDVTEIEVTFSAGEEAWNE
jgi:transposase-like protein